MDIFNNREIALAIWFLIALSYCLSISSIRTAMKSVITVLFRRILVTHFLIMLSYICIVVLFLWKVGIWEIDQLKTSIYWSFSVGAITLFRISNISENDSYLSVAIRDNFKIVVVVEFVAVFYTFSLVAELIIIPIASLVVMMLAVSENKEEHRLAEKFLTAIMTIFGLIMLSYSISRAVTSPSGFFNLQTLRDFYIPPLLSTLFLPYVFGMIVYIGYENAFLVMKFKIEDAEFRAYAKRKAFLSFRADITTLKRWSYSLYPGRIKSRDDVGTTIKEIRELQSREAAPEEVPFEQGWSPYHAKDFLKDVGLPTGFYKKPLDGLDEWWATSSYLDLGEGVFPNSISYYVHGDERAVTSLKLVLDVNEPEHANNALVKLAELAQLLFKKAFHEQCPKDIEASLLAGLENEVTFRTKTLTISREDWNTDKGYTIKLVAKNANETSHNAK